MIMQHIEEKSRAKYVTFRRLCRRKRYIQC